MIDHDQRFKELLREFAREAVSLFLPDLHLRLSSSEMRWQSQDVSTNPPLGLVRRVDLLALVDETRADETTGERVLHLEVESAESLTEVRKKIAYYYPALRTKHNLPVTTFALYLFAGLAGAGWDEYTEMDGETVYLVRWRYAGLPGLDAEVYLASDNWLAVGLASLMRIDKGRKLWLRAEILRRLAVECRENDYRKLLLINCVETYLPIEGQEEAEYLRLVSSDRRYEEVQAVIQTTYDRGIAVGELKAFREMIVEFASPQCGEPGEAILERLRRIEDPARLRALVRTAASASSWDDLLASN